MASDVLIVGAGPAGCVAALVLARAGVKVQLVDREQFPRDKLCGDTLNPGTMSMLERLDGGLGTGIRARSLRVTGMTVTGPGGVTVASDYPRNLAGAALVRRELDLLLLEAAVAAGADFGPGVNVRDAIVTGDGRVCGACASLPSGRITLNAGIIIAADGRRSSLAFGLNLAAFAAAPKRWAFGAYFAGVDGLTTHGEMHIRSNGYLGVAPLPGGLANVCVVRDLRSFRGAAGTTAASVSPLRIANALSEDPILRERFARAEQVTSVTALGPLAVDARAAGRPGLLLAGDAAGFVDPMTGDGMRFAIRGGELAAEAALSELQTGIPGFRQLASARAREFSGKWRINRTLRTLVATPRAVTVAARLSQRWNAPVRALVGIAGDVGLAIR